MENNEQLLLILLGLTVIVGVVGTIGYYFARYGFKSESEKDFEPKQSSAEEAARPSVDPRPAKTTEEKPPVQLSSALEKTRLSFWGRIKGLLGSDTLPKDIRDQVEEVLYTSDLGVATVQRLMNVIDQRLNANAKMDIEQVRQALKQEMLQILDLQKINDPRLLNEDAATALLAGTTAGTTMTWLIVGVNGAGKTTTIGKLAYSLAQKGKKVLVAAGDTFRAAAGAQLKVWSDRAQVEIFSPEGVTDPAAVAYAALERGRAQNFDVVLIDTAGRLHTQKNLMEELKKVKRVMAKLDPQAPSETLLVLDANSGQNALLQAREFHQALNLSGVILTKMDGTAKGGVALSLAVELQLPPRLIGVGERVTDLRPFSAQEYVDAII
ncbi:MAG: signal recognition particle-docking protein FtsY [Bdellovibrionales bacterium]